MYSLLLLILVKKRNIFIIAQLTQIAISESTHALCIYFCNLYACNWITLLRDTCKCRIEKCEKGFLPRNKVYNPSVSNYCLPKIITILINIYVITHMYVTGEFLMTLLSHKIKFSFFR